MVETVIRKTSDYIKGNVWRKTLITPCRPIKER